MLCHSKLASDHDNIDIDVTEEDRDERYGHEHGDEEHGVTVTREPIIRACHRLHIVGMVSPVKEVW